jgi:SOS-response transcriptional repressor LexA
MKGLTGKQKTILAFIRDFMEKEGMSPTVYEIA